MELTKVALSVSVLLISISTIGLYATDIPATDISTISRISVISFDLEI
jgi:hypothetical protein